MTIKQILTFSLIVVFGVFSFIPIVLVSAQEPAAEDDTEKVNELQEKIKEYEDKIEDLQSDAQSLGKEINTLNSQIALTQLRIDNSILNIAQKEEAILELSGDIDNLGLRIDKLIERIQYQQDILNQRIRERYKTRETSPVIILFGTETVNKLVQKATYLRVMEDQDNKVLEQMNATRQTYDRQKRLFEDKKAEEEDLKKQLEIEKANLSVFRAEQEAKRAEKDRLLSITQNNEAKYQELLEEAKKELASYSAFVTASGLGIIGPNGLGGGKDGWYFSQRDSRWANDLIGNSSYTVYQSGCLVSAVAMLHKYYGYDTDPGELADKDSYYFWGNMLVPWPTPSGFNYSLLGYGYPEAKIDEELENDNPVIVGVYANNSAGTHFIVLYDGENGEYKMNDPIYGPDLDFEDYYSTGQIFEAVAFK